MSMCIWEADTGSPAIDKRHRYTYWYRLTDHLERIIIWCSQLSLTFALQFYSMFVDRRLFLPLMQSVHSWRQKHPFPLCPICTPVSTNIKHQQTYSWGWGWSWSGDRSGKEHKVASSISLRQGESREPHCSQAGALGHVVARPTGVLVWRRDGAAVGRDWVPVL